MKALIWLVAAAAVAQVPDINQFLSTDARIRLFESWVAADPASIGNQTLLAGAYLQKTRETNDYGYLTRARKIVDRVLGTMPDYEAQRLRVRIELTLHHFKNVAGYARDLLEGAPADPLLWGWLGDALLEMGDYAGAEEAFAKMLALRADLASWNRVAYLRFLKGDTAGALSMMKQAAEASADFPENKAWVLTELGSLYFKSGDLKEADAAYRQAIAIFPESHAAYAGAGSVEAARGNLSAAVELYKKAQAIAPMVQYAGALFDLYTATGNSAEARRQAARVDLAAALDQASDEEANRTLALIYANQGRNLDQALHIAQADFAIRKGVYTEDALAWALLKNGRVEEARRSALHVAELGTEDPLLLYHSGMIALAAGAKDEARGKLERALALNPQFDVTQAEVARRTLSGLAK